MSYNYNNSFFKNIIYFYMFLKYFHAIVKNFGIFPLKYSSGGQGKIFKDLFLAERIEVLVQLDKF